MYLDPQDGKEPMFKAAVRLLHNHGESLDPLQVLEVSNSLLFLGIWRESEKYWKFAHIHTFFVSSLRAEFYC